MNLLRQILFPFSALYGAVTRIRNYLYDRQILKSAKYPVPIIAVGNLSVGGTGKSPQIEYLIRLLSTDYKVATLSRGYKRKSAGFLLADATSSAETLGDEPYQFYKKFPRIQVAVDANRRNGIKKLLALPDPPQVILLDDAFQHRKVCAGKYILLTGYNDLYIDDFLLPTGNLREGRRGARRADIIIVTKAPSDLSAEAQLKIQLRLKLKPRQKLFFTTIEYDSNVYSKSSIVPFEQIKFQAKVIVAGIAKPKPFFETLYNEGDLTLEFPDHHAFSSSEIENMLYRAQGRPIVTTEKDYVRLQGLMPGGQLFYLPIQSRFLNAHEEFDKIISEYVGKSTANG